jgi:hypothetical protein
MTPHRDIFRPWGKGDTVIASAAKQSMSRKKERMDCFVASLLAMTKGIVEAGQHAR